MKLILFNLLFILSMKAHASFDGVYQMKLSIEDRVFDDVLALYGVNSPFDFNFEGPITGEVQVPGVFTAPLIGTAKCRLSWALDFCSFQFEIVANENGQNFKVSYHGRLQHFTDTFVGEAYLANKKLLGTFVAKKVSN